MQTAATKICSQAYQVASLQWHITKDPKVSIYKDSRCSQSWRASKQTDSPNFTENSGDIIHGHTSPQWSNADVVDNNFHYIVEPITCNVQRVEGSQCLAVNSRYMYVDSTFPQCAHLMLCVCVCVRGGGGVQRLHFWPVDYVIC